MYLWKIERGDDMGRDQTHAAVIAAEYSARVRELAESLSGDQPRSVWHLPTTTVTHIGEAQQETEGVILANFNAG